MEPAYSSGSFVRVDPFAFVSKVPRRLEVISLRSPSHPKRYEIKRIIGLPGERVFWCGGDIWLDGEAASQTFTPKQPAVPGDEIHSLQLRLNEYFVAGDNRLYSQDSRFYGAVGEKLILGKVLS